MIYGIDNSKKETNANESMSKISTDLEELINKRAKVLDRYIEEHKRDYEICLRFEKELTEGLNENKRSKRLHAKNIQEMDEEAKKQIETERAKVTKEK
jgi:hypothetical protein